LQLSGKTDVNMEIRKRKFRWICHTLRKDDEQGNRGRGRARNSWRRSTLRELEEVGVG
jgi:hypothetical protein